MDSYSIRFLRPAEKDLRRIQKSIIPTILENIEALKENPRPAGCRKLLGSESAYRIRVGDYRVVYTIEDTIRIVEIDRIRHRKDVYR
jgi:mRNA interferase RelE/StbE